MTHAEKREWRDIPDYNGRYQVSSEGQVRNAKGLMKTHLNSGGYHYIALTLEGCVRNLGIAGLVLSAFVGPRPKLYQACHNDGDKDNNRLTNLRWAQKTDNEADKIKHGTVARGSRQGLAKLNESNVISIRKEFADGRAKRALARDYGVSSRSIDFILNGKCWGHV